MPKAGRLTIASVTAGSAIAFSKAGLEMFRTESASPETIVLSGGRSLEDMEVMTDQAQLHCAQHDRDAELIPDDVPDGVVTFACVSR